MTCRAVLSVTILYRRCRPRRATPVTHQASSVHLRTYSIGKGRSFRADARVCATSRLRRAAQQALEAVPERGRELAAVLVASTAGAVRVARKRRW